MNSNLIKEIGNMYICIRLLDSDKIKVDEYINEKVKNISSVLLLKRWLQEK